MIGNPLSLCDRCGEEIGLANDLDQAGDIDRRRHLMLVAGKPRRLTPKFWPLFTLLYQHRGYVVDNDRIQAELYDETEQPLAANADRENVRRLRKPLAVSRYEIVNHPTLGYELIVKARRRTRRVAEADGNKVSETFSPLGDCMCKRELG